MALDPKNLKTLIITKLTAAGYVPQPHTIILATAIADSVVEEIKANAVVNGGAVPATGGPVTGAKVS